MIEIILARLHYWVFIALLLIGLHAMIARRNLVRKLIGMSVFQTAIILLFISLAAKWGAAVPISGHGEHGMELHVESTQNPLPHVLMLTAIVVSVSTMGVALAILMSVYSRYRSLEEDVVMERIAE
jgi:multicomponent Na+:H+ antiporter subunit C